MMMTGGFASEDQVFKGLAYGDGYVKAIGLCRSSMAAAMTAKTVGEQIRAGNVPERFKAYGTTVGSHGRAGRADSSGIIP